MLVIAAISRLYMCLLIGYPFNDHASSLARAFLSLRFLVISVTFEVPPPERIPPDSPLQPEGLYRASFRIDLYQLSALHSLLGVLPLPTHFCHVESLPFCHSVSYLSCQSPLKLTLPRSSERVALTSVVLIPYPFFN